MEGETPASGSGFDQAGGGSEIGAGLGGLHAASVGPDAFGGPSNGVPYSDIFTPTGADFHDPAAYFASPVRTTYTAPGVLGDAHGALTFESGNLIPSIPLVRPATAPDDADLKAGPFYVKFRSLDGIVAYDDNYKLSQTQRESELLVLLQLNLTIIAQISDNLQFAVSGGIGYLPLQHQFGLETDNYDVLGLLLFAEPLFQSQVAYDTMVAGWPVTFADDFRIGAGDYSNGTENNFDLFNGDYLQRDENGRYTFRAAMTGLRDVNGNEANRNQSFTYFDNTISAFTQQLAPGEALLTLGLTRDDLWYNDGGRGLPPSRDEFDAALISQRENFRFKPYATYSAEYVQGDKQIPGTLTQVGAIGFFGPIDDQLFVRAQAGFYGERNTSSYLYQLVLTHLAGQYTSEYLSLDRGLTAFDQEQSTSEYYRLEQILGPSLTGDLFLAHASTRELVDDGVSSRNEYLGGAQLGWVLGPKTTLRLAGIYERQAYDDGIRATTITGRGTLDRIITDSLTFQVLYEYQHSVSTRAGDSYFDNLVYFRIIKYL
jgi:hypothetical protein